MTVYVNDREVSLVTGMSVKHALIASGLIDELDRGKKVFDEMENEIGLGGALTEGSKIYVK